MEAADAYLRSCRRAIELITDDAIDGLIAALTPTSSFALIPGAIRRWSVGDRFANPHHDAEDRVDVEVNGFVENYAEVKLELLADGAGLGLGGGCEVTAHLVARRVCDREVWWRPSVRWRVPPAAGLLLVRRDRGAGAGHGVRAQIHAVAEGPPIAL